MRTPLDGCTGMGSCGFKLLQTASHEEVHLPNAEEDECTFESTHPTAKAHTHMCSPHQAGNSRSVRRNVVCGQAMRCGQCCVCVGCHVLGTTEGKCVRNGTGSLLKTYVVAIYGSDVAAGSVITMTLMAHNDTNGTQ